MPNKIKCQHCEWKFAGDDTKALEHCLETGHNDFYRVPVEDVCWSCEERKTTIPVMFPESPEQGAPLKRHWWCEECAQVWLGEAEIKEITTTGVVEECARRGYREAVQ